MIHLDEICIILKYDEISPIQANNESSSIHTLEFMDDISLMKSNSSWNIMKVQISYNYFIHQPWMFSSSLISHSWKLMLLQFGNNSSNQWGYIHPWKLTSSMYIDDLVSCFIHQHTFHFVHQFPNPSSIWMMQMMRMDDDSSLHFHYQTRLNPTSFIQIGCQGNIKFQVLKPFKLLFGCIPRKTLDMSLKVHFSLK